MPDIKFPLLLIFSQALVAHVAFAMPDARTGGICDQAAQRAARSEGVPLEILQAITRVETGRMRDDHLQPWPWTVNLNGRGFWFNTEIEAKSYLFEVFKSGARSFDVGCFQINYRWHGKAFRSIDAMFDPDKNATYAARFLKQLYIELGSWPAAAGAYHSRTPELADAYSARFQTILAQLDGTLPTHVRGSSRDPFTAAAAPLIPLHPAQPQSQQRPLGSLVPTAGSASAFIAFN
ncbi:lytic transglycosylase domain-containing protein [Ruegeria arenilitoris]|uniref:lytic transglycosylase domain-containing protein n=1 Tax=Ruegeria arenilitoris TaxID=1173585 RepID=UPI003463F486